jgi:hypothetical protein
VAKQQNSRRVFIRRERANAEMLAKAFSTNPLDGRNRRDARSGIGEQFNYIMTSRAVA